MPAADFLKGLASTALNTATSAASKNPNIFLKERDAATGRKQNQKLRALQIQGQTTANKAAENKLGFLNDSEKRKRAIQDAVKLDLAKGDILAQKKILRDRIKSESELNRNVDLTDTMTAFQLLNEDPEKFNRGNQRLLKLGQIMGDLPTPQGEKDTRTTLQRNAEFASTPEGAAAIRRLEESKQLPEDPKKEKPQSLQSKEVLVDGKPQLVNRSPQGQFTDLSGNPIDPKSIQPLPKSREKFSVDKDGKVTFERGFGGDKATAPVKTDLQKKLTNNLATQSRLQRISQQFNTEFLTFKGRALNNVFKFFDKLQIKELSKIPLAGKAFDGLDPETKDSVKEFSAFKANVEESFAQFVKSISGAAVSAKEFDRLKNAFINTTQSPEEFKSILDETMDTFDRSNRIFQNLLSEGFDPKTKEGGEKFDDLFSAGKGQSAQERFVDLNAALSSQISDPEERKQAVIEMLESEGFEVSE